MTQLPLTPGVSANSIQNAFKANSLDNVLSVASSTEPIEHFRQTINSVSIPAGSLTSSGNPPSFNTAAFSTVTKRSPPGPIPKIKFSSAGTLTIVGTTLDEIATVGIAPDNRVQVTVNGLASQFFSPAEVKLIRFFGGDGSDRFTNSTTYESVAFGGQGNDELIGGSGIDKFFGEAGDDILKGNAGDDRLRSGDGVDSILGGLGNDVIDGAGGNDILHGDGGNDILRGRRGDDQLFGGDGDDNLFGDADNDSIDTGDGNNRAFGGTGIDNLIAGIGIDVIGGGLHNDTIDGGSGNDIIRGDAGNDTIFGGIGRDQIFGNAGDDLIFGGGGNDTLHGNANNDQIHGERGEDTIDGDHGNDSLYGGKEADILRGGIGHDGLFGGGAVDSLIGNAGNDRFLTQSDDLVGDLENADAQIMFIDKSSTWTDKEIEVIDQGLALLHLKTGNTRLLKDSLPTGIYEFEKVSSLAGNVAGLNSLQTTTETTTDNNGVSTTVNTFDRQIQIADWNENEVQLNPERASLIIHELAHSWDDPQYEMALGANLSDSIWNSFLGLSGWRESDPNNSLLYSRSQDGNWWYLNVADFVSGYSITNPHEDWATVWELFFTDDADSATGTMKQKLSLVDSLFDVVSELS